MTASKEKTVQCTNVLVICQFIIVNGRVNRVIYSYTVMSIIETVTLNVISD